MKKAFRLAVAMGATAAGLALTLPGAVADAAVTRTPARTVSPSVSGRPYAVDGRLGPRRLVGRSRSGRLAGSALRRRRMGAVRHQPGLLHRRGGQFGA
jgi:hypothetical protein